MNHKDYVLAVANYIHTALHAQQVNALAVWIMLQILSPVLAAILASAIKLQDGL